MEWDTLTLEKDAERHFAVITLNRPANFNAISTQLARDLLAALSHIEEDDDIWAAIITGAGEKAFCSGADLKERKNMTKPQMIAQRKLFVKMFTAVSVFPKPLIAAVNGVAFGGGLEIALGCDWIVAAENAILSLSETSIGVIPAGGGTQNMSRVIGKQKAKQLILTARRLTAAEAKEWGFVARVVPQAELMNAAIEEVASITKNAPIAVYQAKKAINFGVDLDLYTGLVLEAEAYNAALYSEDRDEGLAAFNEKRKPVYKGR